LHQLDLDDSYVTQRIKAIAALALEKTAEQINTHDVRDVLKHVTIRAQRIEKLSRKEFEEVTCWAGSHYEIKPEYKGRGDVDYDITYRHDKSHMAGTKTVKEEKYAVLDSSIGEMEMDIIKYRKQKHSGNVGRHDVALIRQYVNLAHIIPENPRAQLDISPPEKTSEEQK